MPTTEAQKRATQKYREKTYKRIPLDVRKEDHAMIKMVADRLGEPLNTFIRKAIAERIERVCGDEIKLEELNFSMEEK